MTKRREEEELEVERALKREAAGTGRDNLSVKLLDLEQAIDRWVEAKGVAHQALSVVLSKVEQLCGEDAINHALQDMSWAVVSVQFDESTILIYGSYDDEYIELDIPKETGAN